MREGLSGIINRCLAIVAGFYLFLPGLASAHEAYVLDDGKFWDQIHQSAHLPDFSLLFTPENLKLSALITAGILIAFTINIVFRRSLLGQKVINWLNSYSRFGPFVIRIAIAASLFFSAHSNSFLAPEISLNSFPYPEIFRIALYVISFMFVLGLLTEVASVALLVIFGFAFSIFGTYIFTYFNYFGETVVLLLFGMRFLSLDSKIFGPLKRFAGWQKYETTVVRVAYGFAFIFAAVTVKLMHPEITETVVRQWDITRFHLLFPSDPALVALGAGITEIAIGVLILVGFQLRLTVLVSLFYLTLSLIFFKEAVWPHFILYGISINLLIQHEHFSIDEWLFSKFRKKEIAPEAQTTLN